MLQTEAPSPSVGLGALFCLCTRAIDVRVTGHTSGEATLRKGVRLFVLDTKQIEHKRHVARRANCARELSG